MRRKTQNNLKRSVYKPLTAFKSKYKSNKEVFQMPRGGARIGAGRPKKPLNDKVLEGNPGKRELTKMQFPGVGEYSNNIQKNSNNSKKIQKPPSYLDIAAKESQRDLSRRALSRTSRSCAGLIWNVSTSTASWAGLLTGSVRRISAWRWITKRR